MGRNLRSVVTRCDAPLPLGWKYVAIKLLTNQTLYFAVELECTVQEVLDQLCFYLGIVDSQLFGLARQGGDVAEFCFVDQAAKLSKLAPKCWRSQTSAGLDGHGRPLILLYLRVQYFVDCLIFWRDRVACHHFYNQIKTNLLSYDWAISQEKAFMLASLALQADLGNYDELKHRGSYFDPTQYFPLCIIQTVGEGFIVANLPLMHRDHRNINSTSAQLAFIREAEEFAMHVYRVQQKRSNYDFTYLGISSSGIQVYQPIATPVLANSSCSIVVTKQCLFPWSDISKLKFDKKRFEIRLEGRCRQLLEFVYVCCTESAAGSLLELCKKTHQFNLAIQPRLAELHTIERRNPVANYRESYIYNVDETSCGKRTPIKGLLNKSFSRNSSPALTGSDPRISVISTSSSNTTSGVMSDKPHSPESEDEESPVPAVGLSLESLPTSHLHKEETGGCSDYGTLENLSKKALSEHNLNYHNRFHREDVSGRHMRSYVMNSGNNCPSLPDALSCYLTAVPEATTLDKAISLDNIALANASLYHSRPQTDLRIAVSYVDAMRATSEEYLSGDSRPQKAKLLYQKNKAQLRAAPQPAMRSTSFAGHQKTPPPIKPRTKIGVSSLSKNCNSNGHTAPEPVLNHLAAFSQPDLVQAPVSMCIDSIGSSDVLDEVRMKSSQHNLPFMSALCQDRSLISKTVPMARPNPTIQSNDSRRFSYCSYLLAKSDQSPQSVMSGSLFKYTSLDNMAPSVIPPIRPRRQIIPHKLSQEANPQRKTTVF